MIFPQEFAEKLKKEVGCLNEEKKELCAALCKGALSSADHILAEMEEEDFKVFELVKQIYYYGYLKDDDKNEILRLLKILLEKLKQNKHQLQDSQAVSNIGMLVGSISDMLTHEEDYLAFVPGAQGREYFKLTDLLKSKEHAIVFDKIRISFRGDKLFMDDKEVQGIKVGGSPFGPIAELVGEHYSNEQSIRNVCSTGRILSAKINPASPGNDPYCYVAEPGKLVNMSESDIRKILGANSAEACIWVRITVPAHLLWIRAKKGYPVKFAIAANIVPVQAPRPQRGFKIKIGGKELYV
jgi:hypothetical protein